MKKIAVRSLILALVLSLCAPPQMGGMHFAHAQLPPADSDPCADEVKARVDGDYGTQLDKQCQAIKDAEAAMKAQTISIVLWSIGAGVCGVSCYYPPVDVDNLGVCGWGTLVLGIADGVQTAILTKEYGIALASLSPAAIKGASLWFDSDGKGDKGGSSKKGGNEGGNEGGNQGGNEGGNQGGNEGGNQGGNEGGNQGGNEADTSAETEGEEEGASCTFTFLTYLVMIGIKALMLESSKDAKKQAQQNAKNEFLSWRGMAQMNPGFAGTRGSGLAASTRTVSGARRSSTGTNSSLFGDSASCLEKPGNTVGELISCAVAIDPNQPVKTLGSEKSAELFKNASGGENIDKLASSLVKSGASAEQALAAATGGMTPEGQAAMQTLLANAKSQTSQKFLASLKAPGSTYAGGGGGRRKKKKRPGIQGMMKDFMNKMMGKDKKKRKPSSVSEIEFKLANGSAEAIMADTDISLFARADFRYRRSLRLLTARPWASRYNRAIAGKKGRSLKSGASTQTLRKKRRRF